MVKKEKKKTQKEIIEDLENKNTNLSIMLMILIIVFVGSSVINYKLNKDMADNSIKIALEVDNRAKTVLNFCNEEYSYNFTKYKECVNYFVPLDYNMRDMLENG